MASKGGTLSTGDLLRMAEFAQKVWSTSTAG